MIASLLQHVFAGLEYEASPLDKDFVKIMPVADAVLPLLFGLLLPDFLSFGGTKRFIGFGELLECGVFFPFTHSKNTTPAVSATSVAGKLRRKPSYA